MCAKRLLITGAAGFIGSCLARACTKTGATLVCADELPFFTSRPEHDGIDFGRRISFLEMFDTFSVESVPFDCVIHLGAITDTMEYDEAKLARQNTDFSKQVWEFCCRREIPLVYASSGATYGDGSEGYSDDEALIPRLKPLNPYGVSKQLFDLWVLEQVSRGHIPPFWVGFKFFNVYGFGERHKGRMASVVLHAYDQLTSEGRIKLFRSHRSGIVDGEQKRDFIFVDDVVDVLIEASQGRFSPAIYNLGTGEARSFLDLACAVLKTCDIPASRIEFIDTPEPLRARYQYFTQAKIEKLRAAGCTKAFTSLERGVDRYVRILKSQPLHPLRPGDTQ